MIPTIVAWALTTFVRHNQLYTVPRPATPRPMRHSRRRFPTMLLLDAAYVRLSSSSTASTTETYIRPLVARIPTMRDNRRHHHQEQPDLPSTLELGVRRLVSMTCISMILLLFEPMVSTSCTTNHYD